MHWLGGLALLCCAVLLRISAGYALLPLDVVISLSELSVWNMLQLSGEADMLLTMLLRLYGERRLERLGKELVKFYGIMETHLLARMCT